jgi:RNA polymerase sigma factor (sigma-70 family)
VQDAFCGLYRHWDRLDDPARALGYVRTAVLNGSRSALRRRTTGRKLAVTHQPTEPSAEASALSREEREEVMRAVRALPGRQREALVLRFYLDLPEREIRT